MNYLGVDFGLKKTGIAIATGILAEPLVVIRGKSNEELIKEIQKIIKEYVVTEIVVGVSEREMGELQKKFAEKLAVETGLRVNLADETLSTYDAKHLGIEAGKTRKKRKAMEDAYAAAIILQNYLDNLE